MEKEFEKLNALLGEAKKELAIKKLDLSSDEDLSLAVMNLISIEEHLFFSAEKTKKKEYVDYLETVREMRKVLMKKLIPEYEGEVWCVSKHLFASSMRVMEVGTKKLSDGKKQEAYDLFDQAYSLYSLFWALRLKMIDVAQFPEDMRRGKKEVFREDGAPAPVADGTKNKSDAIKDFVSKLVDCCGE